MLRNIRILDIILLYFKNVEFEKKYCNKNKTKTNNLYFKGKNGFNPYNYDYNSKFRFYMP